MSSTATQSSVEPPVENAVAPFIREAVGDVNRPRGVLTGIPRIGHLPGETSFLAGMRMVYGRVRRGNAYMLEQTRRFGPVFRAKLGLAPFVAVGDPELVLRVLRNDEG